MHLYNTIWALFPGFVDNGAFCGPRRDPQKSIFAHNACNDRDLYSNNNHDSADLCPANSYYIHIVNNLYYTKIYIIINNIIIIIGYWRTYINVHKG